MVDVAGHLGMALLWLAPAWFFVDDRKTAATFVAASFWFGLLPDIDLYLSRWFEGIHHHGVFHTILVVTIMAAIVGPALGWVLKAWLGDSEWFSARATDRAYTVGFLGVWVAGLSHVFADMLSAPDVASQVEPLWPLIQGPVVALDVLYYQSFWATWALLAAGVLVNVGLWYWKRGRQGRAVATSG